MQPYPTWQNIYGQMQQQQNPYAQFIGRNDNTLPGKYVNDFSEITASDVPMNGLGGIFIKLDLSEVQIKKWESNGTISTRAFKIAQTEYPNNVVANNEKAINEPFNEFVGTFNVQMQQLNDKLDKLSEVLQ